MKRHFKLTQLTTRQYLAWQYLAAITAVLLLLTLVTIAQAGSFTLTRSTVDSGGGALSNGEFTLIGAIGQPDAGGVLSNGGYTLSGGAFAGPSGSGNIYLPLILRQ